MANIKEVDILGNRAYQDGEILAEWLGNKIEYDASKIGGGGSGETITPVLELKQNTDTDPVINLTYEVSGQVMNSPVSFDKEDFEIQNNHMKVKNLEELKSNVEELNESLTTVETSLSTLELNDKYTEITLPFTAPKNGEINWRCGTSSKGDWYLNLTISRNGSKIFDRQNSGYTTYTVSDSFVVKKGDVISLNSKGGVLGTPYYWFR